MTWRDRLLAARAEGWDVLDWLSAVDEGQTVRVVACLLRGHEYRLISCEPGEALVSVADVYPSAAWHERETAEMFGVRFAGHPDPRPLLLAEGADPPLRRGHPLPARLTDWPGRVDPAKPHRTIATPGAPWV